MLEIQERHFTELRIRLTLTLNLTLSIFTCLWFGLLWKKKSETIGSNWSQKIFEKTTQKTNRSRFVKCYREFIHDLVFSINCMCKNLVAVFLQGIGVKIKQFDKLIEIALPETKQNIYVNNFVTRISDKRSQWVAAIVNIFWNSTNRCWWSLKMMTGYMQGFSIIWLAEPVFLDTASFTAFWNWFFKFFKKFYSSDLARR